MFQFDGLRQRMSKPPIQITNSNNTNTNISNGSGAPSSLAPNATVGGSGTSSSTKLTNSKRNSSIINNGATITSASINDHGSLSINPSLLGNNKKMNNLHNGGGTGGGGSGNHPILMNNISSSSSNTTATTTNNNPYYGGSTNSLASFPSLSSPTDSTISTSFTTDPHTIPIPVIQYQAILSPTAVPSPVGKEAWYAFFISYANIRLTIATLVFWVSIIIFHQYLTKFTLYRGTVVHDMRNTPPLYDLFHEIFPNLQPYRIIPEVLHVIPVLYLSGLMIYYFDQRSIDCIRTYLWIHGCIMFMRACSFTSTLLPDASQTCHKSLYTGSCHDLIFSGHVVIMILSVLMMQHFFWVPGFIRLIMGIDSAIASLLIIITHNHYAVDVLLAIFIVPFVFLAFTRHPVLASLGCLVPEKLLAKSSRLNIRNRNGFCSCRRSPNVKYGKDGYEVYGEDDVQKLTDHAHATLKLFGLHPKIIIYRAGEKIPIFSDEPTTDENNELNRARGNVPHYGGMYDNVDLPSISQQMDTALENISKLQVQAFNEAQVIASAKAKAQALQNRSSTLNTNNIVSIHQLISRPIQVRNRHYDIDNPYQQQLSNTLNNNSNNTNSINVAQPRTNLPSNSNGNRIRSNNIPSSYPTNSIDENEIDSNANDSPNEEYFEENNYNATITTGNTYHHLTPSNYSIPLQHQHTNSYNHGNTNTPPYIPTASPPVILLQHVQPRTTVPVLLKYTTNNPNNGYYDSPSTHSNRLHSNIMDNYHHRDEDDSLIDDTSVNDPQESATSGNSVNGSSAYDTANGKKGKKKVPANYNKGNNNNHRSSSHRLIPTTGETNNSPSPNGPNNTPPGNNSNNTSSTVVPNNSSNNNTISSPRISEVDTNQETETDSSSTSESPSRPLTSNVTNTMNVGSSSLHTTSSSSLYHPVEILQTYYCNECAAYHPINVEPHSSIPTTNHLVWRGTGGPIPSSSLSSSLSTVSSLNTPPNSSNSNNTNNNSNNSNRRHRSQTFDSGVRNSQAYHYNPNVSYVTHNLPSFSYPHHQQQNNPHPHHPTSSSSRNSSASSRNRHTTTTTTNNSNNSSRNSIGGTTNINNSNNLVTPINTPSTPHRSHTTGNPNLSNPASPHTNSANRRK